MVIGHSKQLEFFKKINENKKFSHAYLFSGQEKLGKRTAALEWLSWSFGSIKNHPDFILIEPIKKEIQIFQIKDLIQRLSFKPSLAPLKAALIDNAHLMNQEAQTALLKTLEEPKGETLLILISHKAQELLPTIISRLQIVKFNPVEKQAIKKVILKNNFSDKEAEKICHIVSGRPGLAFDFISSNEKLQEFDHRIEELIQVPKWSFYRRFQYVKNLSENLEETKNLLDIWLAYFRRILLDRFNSLALSSSAFERYSNKKIRHIINLIEKNKLLISQTNINTKLALERLILQI